MCLILKTDLQPNLQRLTANTVTDKRGKVEEEGSS